MELEELKNKIIKEELNINENFGKIFSFIDFGNVNKWFEKDRQNWDNEELEENEKIDIDIKKLEDFTKIFSEKTRCYYGKDPKNKGSINFDYALRRVFGKNNFVSKDLQKIKHYIEDEDSEKIKLFETDDNGKKFVKIRKCNFDVEISVDAI